MIDLASPDSHSDPAVRDERYQAACRTTAAPLKAGLVVFSPIVHSHPLGEFEVLAGWDFWQRIDREMLTRCDEVLVLMLNGWEASVGVREEVRLARALGKPVRYLAPESAPGTPTLARVAASGPESDPTPTRADCPPPSAHNVSELLG